MGTKWKRFNLYNFTKFLFALIMIASITVMAPIADYGSNNDINRFENFEDTYIYEQLYNDLIHNIVEYYVVLQDEENIHKIIQEELNQEYGYNSKQVYTEDDEAFSNRMDRYLRIEDNLKENINFIYYIENTETEEIYTNIKDKDPISFLESQNSYVYYDSYRSDNNMEINYNHDIHSMIKGTDYKVHAAVYKSLRMGDDFFTEKAQFNQLKYHFPKVRTLFLVSSITFILSLAILSIMVGKDKPSSYKVSSVGKVYNEVQLLMAFGCIILIGIFLNIIQDMGIYAIDIFGFDKIHEFHIGLYFAVFILLALSFLSQWKNNVLFTNTFTCEFLKGAFNTKLFLGVCLFLMIFLGGNGILVIFILMGIGSNPISGLIGIAAFIGFNLAILHFVQQSLNSLKRIMEATKEYARGDYARTYPLENISISFRGFYKDILSIKNSMEDAISEAVKGERLKTELITNVSHDLKTPLTSIINYVELLKREEIENERAVDYIGVLDEKSTRLKQLVEDLLEASKASSGSIQVELQELDLNELLQQAIGEYEDRLISLNLELIVNTSHEPIIVKGDSKHLWRVMENVFSNILKYAMKGTRVYSYIEKKGGYGTITFKNISAEPLDITPEELTQRFVRGESSRTTEGSGLGLSIVESLVRVQGGDYNIGIDGDLFKIELRMPIERTDA